MGRDDLFRRTFEAGMSFLDMSRERAEALVKDLVKAGEVQKGKAQKAIDELLERSRKGGEGFRSLIQREINQQMTAMGLATREDIARLEARLAEMAAAGGPGPTGAPTAPTAAPPAPEATAAPAAPEATAAPSASPPPPTAAPAKSAPVKRARPPKASAPATAGTATAKKQVPPLKKAGPPRKKAAAPAPPPADKG